MNDHLLKHMDFDELLLYPIPQTVQDLRLHMTPHASTICAAIDGTGASQGTLTERVDERSRRALDASFASSRVVMDFPLGFGSCADIAAKRLLLVVDCVVVWLFRDQTYNEAHFQ